MAHTRTHSYCWAFCLSFACMFTWFVPVEALFSAPAPRPADDGVSEVSSEVNQRPVPKHLVRDHQTVFGESILDGAWAKKSGSAWDGLAPHIFVSLDGPSVFTPTTETDITAEVMAEAPSVTDTRYISTTGWLTGSEGTFPVHFLVCSEGSYSAFFFTGIVPTELFMQPISNISDGSSESNVPERCNAGVDGMAQCDALLDFVLAHEGSQAAESLRTVLKELVTGKLECWAYFGIDVQAAEDAKEAAISAARTQRNILIAAAIAAAILCYAVASKALAVCLATSVGWSFFGLWFITVAHAVACAAAHVAGMKACTAGLLLAVTVAVAAYLAAKASAEETYDNAITEAKRRRDVCLEAANRAARHAACQLIPALSPFSLAAASDHQSCYGRIAYEHADCLSLTGENVLVEHGLHLALDTCGAND